MDIRNILHQKKENKAQKFRFFLLIILCILILYILWVLIYKDKNREEYFIWEEISAEGILEIHNNYPTNTHKLISGKKIYGLKSSSININKFIKDKVSIKGNISTITNDFPVIEINNLSIPDKKVKISNNIYSFSKDLLYFDFSQEKEFYAEKEWNSITIYQQDTPVLEIDTFICNKVAPSQDCEGLIESYKKNDNEFFSSYRWDVFYKISDNKRITFNDNTLWYIIKTIDDDFLLNISHLINIINADFISKNKKDFIVNSCNEWDNQNWTIQEIKKDIIDSDLIKIDTKLSKNWDNINCKLNIDIYNDREVKNKSTD